MQRLERVQVILGDVDEHAFDDLLTMQREARAGTLLEHPIRKLDGLEGCPTRLIIAPREHERVHEPRATLRVERAHVEIGEIARTQLDGGLHGLPLEANRFIQVIAVELVESHPHAQFNVRAARGEARIRRLRKRLHQVSPPDGEARCRRVVAIAQDHRLHEIALREGDGRGLRMIAASALLLEQLDGFGRIRGPAIQIAEHPQGPRVVNQCQRAVASRFRSLQCGWQSAEVVDLPLRELRHHVQPAKALQLAREVVREIAQQMFGLTARLLCDGTRLLSFSFCPSRSLHVEQGERRGNERHGGQ